MPRKWHTHWPIQDPHQEADRDRIVHTLGNLTLLTGKLNSKVSNGPWLGTGGKREGLEGHDVLLLNREILKRSPERWIDELIHTRTQELARIVCQIWTVPPNHRSGFAPDRPRLRKKIDLSDLIAGGALEPGTTLYPRRKKHSHQAATLLADGQVEVDGVPFPTASDAATAIVGKRTNGWAFFLIDQVSKRSLAGIRRDYINAMAVDAEDEESDEDDEEDEA